MATDPSTCGNCMFWKQSTNLPPISGMVGKCRVNAPDITAVIQIETAINRWPYTTSDAWCGDWKSK